MKYDGYQVGIVIKSLRIQRNLTKEALATELGISESTIKKYENGERALSITNLFITQRCLFHRRFGYEKKEKDD